MAPKYPDELDVFTVPHNRMKALVQQYCKMLTSTNFSSACEVMQLLKQLGTTFKEFKEHETIENKYIMQKLQHKLQQLSITNNVVCNCHKDYKLSQMLQLLEDGLSKCSKTDQDRLNYGLKLRMALDDFTKDFIPHMQEEEEILQPLLVEHFSYEELKEIQTQVIDHHTHLEHKDYVTELYQNLLHDTFYGNTESKMKEAKEKEICDKKETSVLVEQQLPDEVWLQIFSFLNPLELMHCSKISVNWNRLSMDPSLWTVLNPTYWTKGFWTFKSDEILLEEVALSGVCPQTAILFDEDADIDESTNTPSKYFIENKFMTSLSESPFLERIGHGVQKLDLAYSHGITDDLLRIFLTYCPNLEFLDISQTKISDKAFKSLGKNGCGYKLHHLDFTGCINITDKTLKKIALIVRNAVSDYKLFPILKLKCSTEVESCPCPLVSLQCGGSMQHKNSTDFLAFKNNVDLLPDCCIGCTLPMVSCPLNANKYESVVMYNRDNLRTSTSLKTFQNELMSYSDFLTCDRTLVFDNNVENTKITPQSCDKQNKGLTYLNLSGCFHITNEGLRALSTCGKLSNLTYLDLSGCLQVSGDVLENLVESCPKLKHEFLFYCDNISNDPYEYTASGCQNLQCSNRVCCRNGE